MAVRIKDGMIPYTGGQGIEITNNHVINVLLRELNNLIMVNEDRELYVDLQLPDGIAPEDDFPVGVTTGKILQADGWQQSGIILNWKTTSGDYVRFIYANDGKLYYDPGTGTWIEIGSGGGGVQINVATASTLGLIKLGTDTQQLQAPVTATSISGRTYPVQLNADNQAVVNIPWEDTTYTAGANIVIDQNNVISTTIPSALVYKGNVTDIADLPSSGQTVGDTYFVEGEDAMYSWDGTQWNYVGGTGIDVSNLFNKTTDDSDDIVQGSTHLFVTQSEKNYWNSKLDSISAGNGIDVTNNVISNTLPFEPENTGSLGRFLKKTNTGYAWANVPSGGSFNPENEGTAGQILTKTGTGYEWRTSSGEQDVKVWKLTLNNTSSIPEETLSDIVLRCLGENHSAIIKPNAIASSLGVHVFGYSNTIDGVSNYHFPGIYDTTETTTTVNGQFTTEYNPDFIIHYDGESFTCELVYEKKVGNYLTVEDSGYTTAYMPTAGYQPTTKAYVDSRNWTGTLSQYNALTTIDPDVVYNITSLN